MVGDQYGGVREPIMKGMCGQGFDDIHAEQGEGYAQKMGQKDTPNRGKRVSEVRLPCVE